MSSAKTSHPGTDVPGTDTSHIAPATNRPEPPAASSTSQSDLRAMAENAMSDIGAVAKEAAGEAQRSATALATEANEKLKAFMGQKVGAGAHLVGHVAASARVAADDLDRNAPQLAALVRDASQRIEQLSRELQGQSIDQLMRRTSDFARERPAAMFGAAAACGFFLFRMFKAGTGPSSDRSGEQHAPQQATFGATRYRPDSPPTAPNHGPVS
jgi:ElaB/YqjD/DUF883 family membrane-anchored ribosome-binding protein